MVALDDAGQVIRPRSSGTTRSPHEARTGCSSNWTAEPPRGGRVRERAVAAFTITKLSWLHRKEPEHWGRLATVLLPHDWLTSAHRPAHDRPW